MESDGRISQVYFFDAIRSGLIEMIELSYICVATLFYILGKSFPNIKKRSA